MNRALLATALTAMLATAPYAQLNLLTNPGFESGKTSWTLYVNSSASDSVGTPDATLSTVAAALHSGTRGAQIQVAARNANNWDIQLQPPQTWNAEKGVYYHMSFWGKSLGTKAISVAAALGPAGGYKYLDSWGFSLTSQWKQYEVYYKSPATGVDSLRLNLYLGADTGTYMFDDFVLDTVPSGLPSTMTQPSRGAWYTGVYRNLFAELGYSQATIDAKVDAAFAQLFLTGDSASERLFYMAKGDTSMGFIDNVEGYALTEGQSYAMMIALQMNRQDIFNKLWKFAKNHMQQQSGDLQGYFAWKVSTSAPYTPADVNPAPDGDEYFATALFLATKRWGNGAGIYNYQQQADSLLFYFTKAATGSMLPLIVPDRKQIVFSPAQVSDPYTDPSYHLPAFYRLWDAFASDRKSGFYAAMADTSWAYLKRTQNATTGLFPEYSTFDGEPKTTDFNKKSHTFASDAHRVSSNMGFSWAWFMDDTGAMRMVKKELAFFASQTGGYKAEYTLDGTANVEYSSQSIQSANAGAVLASDNPADWAFVDALWKLPVSSGQYRYYNGLLQMLNLLHVSGKFQAWGSPGLPMVSVAPRTSANTFRTALAGRNLTITGLSSDVRVLDVRGRELVRLSPAAGTVRTLLPGAGAWILDAGTQGRKLVAIP